MRSRRLFLALTVVLGGACGEAESTGYHPGVTDPQPDAGVPGTGGFESGGRRGKVPVGPIYWGDAGEGTGGAGPGATGGAPGTGGAVDLGTGGAPGATGGMVGTGGAGTGGMSGTGGASGAPDALPPIDTAPPAKQYVSTGTAIGTALATHCQTRGYAAVAQPRGEAENAALLARTGPAGAWLGIMLTPGDRAWHYMTATGPGAVVSWAKWAAGEPRAGTRAVLSEGEWYAATDDQTNRVFCEK